MSAAIALSFPAVAPAALGDLVQAVVDAAAAEQAYYAGDSDPRSLRDLELFAVRIEAESALHDRLVALGVNTAQARIMAEALS